MQRIMSELETSIRTKAINEASIKFNTYLTEAIKMGWSVSTADRAVHEAARGAMDTYFKQVVAPKVAARAVDNFLQSYQKLVVEFPQLVGEPTDEA